MEKISERQPDEIATPDTVIGLLKWTISDPGRTNRFITVLRAATFSGLLIVAGLVVPLGAVVIVLATQKTQGISHRSLLTGGIYVAATLLVSATISVTGSIRRLVRRKIRERKERRVAGQAPAIQP